MIFALVAFLRLLQASSGVPESLAFKDAVRSIGALGFIREEELARYREFPDCEERSWTLAQKLLETHGDWELLQSALWAPPEAGVATALSEKNWRAWLEREAANLGSFRLLDDSDYVDLALSEAGVDLVNRETVMISIISILGDRGTKADLSLIRRFVDVPGSVGERAVEAIQKIEARTAGISSSPNRLPPGEMRPNRSGSTSRDGSPSRTLAVIAIAITVGAALAFVVPRRLLE